MLIIPETTGCKGTIIHYRRKRELEGKALGVGGWGRGYEDPTGKVYTQKYVTSLSSRKGDFLIFVHII